MNPAGANIFITGATGFIGRHIVRQCLDAGAQVTAMVRADSAAFAPNVRLVNGRVQDDIESLAAAMRGHDAVIHNAGLITFDPRRHTELRDVNAEGTRRILAAARLSGVSRCVVVSSGSTIGLSHDPASILDENTPFDERLAARNPYMASKCAGELHAFDAARAGQHVVIVNPTTVLGPGDWSLNSGSLFKQVATAVLLPIPCGGSNFIAVEDVADGILAALQRGRTGERYILGAHNLRYRELLGGIADVIGRHPISIPLIPLTRVPMKTAAWLVQRLTRSRLITPQVVEDTFVFKFFSSQKAAEQLAWRPRRELRQTLADAWAYYRREELVPSPRTTAPLQRAVA